MSDQNIRSMIADMVRDPAEAQRFLDDPSGFMSSHGTRASGSDLESLTALAQSCAEGGPDARHINITGHINVGTAK